MKSVRIFFIFILFELTAIAHQLTVKEVSDNLKTCYSDDNSKLPECLVTYFNESLPLLTAGIDGNGPKLDPMEEENWILPENTSISNGLIEHKSIKIKGISKMVITDVVPDITELTIIVYGELPLLIYEAKYTINATFALIPVVGNGDILSEGTDCNITSIYYFERYEHGTRLARVTFKVDVKHFTVKVEGLDKSFEAIPKLLNEKANLLYEETRPITEVLLSKQIQQIYDPLFKEFPFEILT